MITIDKKSDCSGCEACATACPVGCITFEADGEGFLYPIVDVSRCIGCEACNDVCPVESPRHPIAPRATFGVINPNRAVRRLSSSGGLFYLLAEGVIERGGVVFGAAFDEAGMVVHRGVESREGLDALRGSKYSQSHLGSAYAEALQALADGRELFFRAHLVRFLASCTLYLRRLERGCWQWILSATESPRPLFGERDLTR